MSDGKQVSGEDICFASASSAEIGMNEEKTMKEYTIDIIKHFLKKYDNNVVKVPISWMLGNRRFIK